MHIDAVPNRGSRPAYLLRESYREGDKVKKRTLANVSSLSDDQIDAMRRILKGERLVAPEQLFDITRSRAHGHVDAALRMLKKLRLDQLLASRPCRQRDLVVAMIAARIVSPASKLATSREWRETTLPELTGVGEANEDELYEAMDWLLERQGAIEKKLARRHLSEGGLALFDTTSSYVEGRCCPLAARGYNRDKKKGKLQVNYGLLADAQGRPVALSVFPGNTSDSKTLLPQLTKIREDFKLKTLTLVGDRGIMSQVQIDEIKKIEGLSWITALKAPTILRLVEDSTIQLGLFDARNLATVEHAGFPGERLIVCRNPELARRRAETRQTLIERTRVELLALQERLARGRQRSDSPVGVRVGQVINKFKVAKHFTVRIHETNFDFQVAEDRVAAEAQLDGLYVLRTPVPKEELAENEVVLAYKSLTRVEQAFRRMKGMDLQVRPIYHYTEPRVRAHLFLCMLAYYVQWHLIEAWAPLLFKDEEGPQRQDAVSPAERSESAQKKASSKQLEDGSEVHSLRTLLRSLASVVKNSCRQKGVEESGEFELVTQLDEKQAAAFKLIDDFVV